MRPRNRSQPNTLNSPSPGPNRPAARPTSEGLLPLCLVTGIFVSSEKKVAVCFLDDADVQFAAAVEKGTY